MGRFAALGTLLSLLLLPSAADADGALPARSYRYLHPPPALAATNKPPLTGLRTVPFGYLRAGNWGIFTDDQQAGLTGAAGALARPAGAGGVAFTITPIDTPAGLTSQVAADGNAYRFSALLQPNGAPVRITGKVRVVLRWPHLPVAIFHYTSGRWHRLCYSDQAILTSTLISCGTKSLGVFLAVTTPSNIGSGQTPTPAAGLSPYLPFLVAAALIVLVVMAGYLALRRRH